MLFAFSSILFLAHSFGYPIEVWLGKDISINISLLILSLGCLGLSLFVLHKRNKKNYIWVEHEYLLWKIDILDDENFKVHRVPYCYQHKRPLYMKDDTFYCYRCTIERSLFIPRQHINRYIADVEKIVFAKMQAGEI